MITIVKINGEEEVVEKDYIEPLEFNFRDDIKRVILSNIASIGMGAFSNCNNLEDVEIIDVGNLELGVFSKCNNIKNIYCECKNILPDNLKHLYVDSIHKINSVDTESITLVIDNKTKNLDAFQYSGDLSIVEIIVASKEVSIPDKCFEGCLNLKRVLLKSNRCSVKNIGNSAFKDCKSLSELDVSLFDKCVYIGESAFENCKSIEEIVIPGNNDSKRLICKNAFKHCESLKLVEIHKCRGGSSSIGEDVFEGTNSSLRFDLVGHSKISHISICSGSRRTRSIDDSDLNKVINLLLNCLNFDEHFDLIRLSDKYRKFESEIDSNGRHYSIIKKLFESWDINDSKFLRGILENEYIFNTSKMFWDDIIKSSEDGILDLSNEKLTTLPGYFLVNTTISKVILPKTLQYLETGTFRDCPNLKVIDFSRCENHDIKIDFNVACDPYGVKSSSEYLYSYTIVGREWCEKYIKSIDENENFKKRYCKDRRMLELIRSCAYRNINYSKNGILDLSNYAFESLTQEIIDELFHVEVTKVIFPKSLKSILTFRLNCVKSLDFSRCEDIDFKLIVCRQYNSGNEYLEEVIFPENMPKLYEGSYFANRGYGGLFFDNSNLRKVKLPNNLEELGDGIFAGCLNLEDIEIPDSVFNIGMQSFVDCRSLEKVIIPDSVINIGIDAFRNCKNLKYVRLGKNINVNINDLFYGCDSVEIIQDTGE